MGAGLFPGDPAGDPAGVPCDPEQWSDASKRSVAYDLPPRPYRDKAYRCCRCETPDVFTAAEQRHDFEVRKVSICAQRVLCRACHAERARLDQTARDHRRRWAIGRSELRGDAEFIRGRLAVLEALPAYGGEPDRANIVMLNRLLVASSGSGFHTRDGGGM